MRRSASSALFVVIAWLSALPAHALKLSPRLDPSGKTGIWIGPHINVQVGGMNVHIPVDPSFVP